MNDSDSAELLVKVSQVAEAASQGPPNPDNYGDDYPLDSYLGQIVEPDEPDQDADNTGALIDSTRVGLHLAKCKLGILRSDHQSVHENLNKAMTLHARLHGQIAAARASEMNPNAVRDQQD